MPAYLTPGVTFEAADRADRVDRRQGGIAALRTDVAGFVGVAERGPLDEPVRVESFEQFRSVFGELLPAGFLAYALKAFFENGGRRAWCVRVAGASAEIAGDPAVPLPADGAFATVEPGSDIAALAGFIAGGVVTVSQGDALRFNHRLAAVDPLRRRLIFERPLSPRLQPLAATSFASGPAAAWAELPGGDGVPTLRLAAANPGAWGNGLEVRFGRSAGAATASRPVPQPQDRRSSLVADVVGFGPGTLVRLFQRGATNREAYRVVLEVDPVRRLLTWSEPLPAGFDLGGGLSLESVELGLTVVRDGRAEEVFSGLSLVPAHPRYVERAVGASRWVRAVDLQAHSPTPSPFPDRLPNLAVGSRRAGAVELAGGRDGLATLTAAHLIGDPATEVRRGLRALEAIDEVALVAIPDSLIRPAPPVQRAPRPVPEPDPCCPRPAPEPPPGGPLGEREDERAPDLGLDGLFTVQEALIAHCETLRDRFALLDPPLVTGASEGGIGGIGAIQAWRERFDSRYAALYHPWIQVYDPRRPRGALVKPVPPSGHVAGIYARTDLAVGVHKAPANEELRWAQGLTQELGDAEQGLLNPLGINCLRAFPGRGLRVYGARTLSSDTPWRYVPVRRLVTMIAEALEEALAWAVFEPHDDTLRQTITVAIGSFLEGLWGRGALAGTTPAEAFVVRCDRRNNPQEAVDRGELLAEVGVAPAVPAEFVVLRIGRAGDTLEIREV